MNNYCFKSILSDELSNFIDFKRSLGYKYDINTIFYCKCIDRFWIDKGFKQIKITQDIAYEYAVRKQDEKTSTLKNRLYIFKHFSMFLVKQGYENIYVYDKPIKQDKDIYIPYIYTDDDMIKIFDYIKNCNSIHKTQFLILFELFYSTGIRLSEAINIKIKNINLENRTIEILNSKNFSNRLVCLSNSMYNELKKYLNNKFKNNDDYLFCTKNNNHFCKASIDRFFRKLIKETGIGTDAVNSPRIHDFRHSFAIKTLDLMYEKGYDYYNALPLLQKYMGHRDIRYTEYYLKLTKYYHHKVIEVQEFYNNNIIPEVK